jgi:hypothetical protein
MARDFDIGAKMHAMMCEREARCVRSSMLCHGGRDRADNCGDREAQWLETTDVALAKGATTRILDFQLRIS